MPKKTDTPASRVWELHFVAPISVVNPRGGARAPLATIGIPSTALTWDVCGGVEFRYGGELVRVPYSAIKAAFLRDEPS